MDIFKLVGSVFIDTEKANDSLKKTDDKAKQTGKTFGSIMGTAGKVGGAIVGAAGAAVSGMVALASQTASNADVIDKMSIRMGIGAETLQQYTYAAGLAGVETGTLEKAAKKLEGTDLNFDEAMQSIMSFATEEERMAAATDLFGESVAYQLTPMISQTKDELNSARQEAYDLGLVMSNDDVKAGAALNDAMSKVQQSFQAVITKLGTALMPLVEQFSEMIIAYMPQIQAFMDRMIPIITSLFDGLMPPLMQLVEELFPIAMDLLEEILPVVTEIISAILPIIVELIQTLAPVLVDIVKATLPLALDLIKALLPILKPIIELLAPILKLVVTLLEPMLMFLDTILPPLISIIVFLIDTALKPLTIVVDGVANVFRNMSDAYMGALKAMKDKTRAPLNAIIGGFNKFVAGVVCGVNGVIRAINSFKIDVPGWVTTLTGMSSFGFHLGEISAPQIPLLAKGGEIDGGSAIVGEDGPELLQTNGKSTRVTPLNDNNNAFVGMEKKLDRLIELMENGFGVYINGNALVGQVASDMDMALGRMANNKLRRV